MSEKVSTTLATNREEDFEFGTVARLPDGRLMANVCNTSHDDPQEHTYLLFFRVERDETGGHVRVVGCGCPAAEYHNGICKHCETAAECAELLGRVIEVALEDDSEDETTETAKIDGERTAVVADGGIPDIDRIKRVREEEERRVGPQRPRRRADLAAPRRGRRQQHD